MDSCCTALCRILNSCVDLIGLSHTALVNMDAADSENATATIRRAVRTPARARRRYSQVSAEPRSPERHKLIAASIVDGNWIQQDGAASFVFSHNDAYVTSELVVSSSRRTYNRAAETQTVPALKVWRNSVKCARAHSCVCCNYEKYDQDMEGGNLARWPLSGNT